MSLSAETVILSADEETRVQNDHSMLQLTAFESLYRLELSASLPSFENDEMYDWKSLRNMFPDTLEELEVHYGCPSGLLWSVGAFDIPDENLTRTETTDEQLRRQGIKFEQVFEEKAKSFHHGRSQLAWYMQLMKLRKDKSFTLPKLRSLKIMELDDPYDIPFQKVDFIRLGYHSELFVKLGVDFEIILRAPEGWNVSAARVQAPGFEDSSG